MSDQQALLDQAAAALRRVRTMEQPAALAYLKEMDPTVFEHLTALLFEERGYPAVASGKPGDEGVDVLLRDGDYTGVVQCKRYDGSVGQPTIRDLYGTMMHNDAAEAYLVTTGTVTRQARDWAFGKPISLIDGHALAAWVTQTKADRTGTGGFASGSFASGGFLRSRWVMWPLMVAGLLLFGWGVFYAVSQLSDRFSDAPTAQSIEQGDDLTAAADGAATSDNTSSDGTSSDNADVDSAAAANPSASTSTVAPADVAQATVAQATVAPTVLPTETPTSVPSPIIPPATNPPVTNPPPTVANAVAAPSPTPQPTPSPTPQPTTQPAPQQAATSTIATSTTAACQFAVDAAARQWYARDRMGCATGELRIVWAAWQPFERGAMLWRSDTDAAYAFVADPQQQWFEIRERWDGSSSAEREEDPPPGLQAPTRGFGYAWGVNDALFGILGWATDGEKGFCLAVQQFERGVFVQSNRAQSCTDEDLFNQARGGNWRPFTYVAHDDGSWE